MSQQERGATITLRWTAFWGTGSRDFRTPYALKEKYRARPTSRTFLYKYVPKDRIGNGAPNSLRATQILALNDDMECNLETRNDMSSRMSTLDFPRPDAVKAGSNTWASHCRGKRSLIGELAIVT